MNKRFYLVPGSNAYGVLYDETGVSRARFINLREARFEASFSGVREAQLTQALKRDAA